MNRVLSTIEVTVTGLRTLQGQVLLALWRSGDGFPDEADRAAATLALPVVNAIMTAQFRGLPPGSYAVAAVHDANSNGKLDTTWFGVPKEGIGFSNNPTLRFSAPKFASCAVRVAPRGDAAATVSVAVRMRYFLP